MKISILGTGQVAQTLAEKFLSLSHQVMLGTRNVQATLDRKATGDYGSTSYSDWQEKNEKATLGTFKEAAAFGEIIVNALNGSVTLDTLKAINVKDLENKILIDVANPLDFSKGFPPTLLQGLNNDNSLGEEIQKLLPATKIVKTFNTMYCGIMVNPQLLDDGNHINFICGNDDDAKATVKSLLNDFGWQKENILDLGDITNARGTESMLPVWIRIFGVKQTGMFNFSITKSGV